MSKRIVIIGAGLAGTTAARELNARGQAVTVSG
ncbi:MAG: FAD-binding protein [Actinomycetota bacterium]